MTEYNHSEMNRLNANVVCKDDEFHVWNDETGEHLLHEPKLERDVTKDEIIAAYCTYTTPTDGHRVVVMNRKQLNEVEKASTDDRWGHAGCYAQMARKAVVEMAMALHLETTDSGDLKD